VRLHDHDPPAVLSLGPKHLAVFPLYLPFPPPCAYPYAFAGGDGVWINFDRIYVGTLMSGKICLFLAFPIAVTSIAVTRVLVPSFSMAAGASRLGRRRP